MKLHEIFDNSDLHENLTRRQSMFGLGASALAGSTAIAHDVAPANAKPVGTATSHQTPPATATSDTAASADSTHEKFIINNAARAGLSGNELAAFVSQLAHETLGFHRLIEKGSPEYFRHLYDIKGNPSKAKLLGNTQPGDGERYKGRGYIHLSGKENYRKVGDALNVPLLQHPELAAKPDVALRIALWFWKHRVQPHVTDWNDVRSVTKKINPGLKGLDDRTSNYHYYKKLLSSPANLAQAK